MFGTKMKKIPLAFWRVLRGQSTSRSAALEQRGESLGISEIAQQIR